MNLNYCEEFTMFQYNSWDDNSDILDEDTSGTTSSSNDDNEQNEDGGNIIQVPWSIDEAA